MSAPVFPTSSLVWACRLRPSSAPRKRHSPKAKDELLEGKEELVPMDVIDCVDERGAKEELVPQEELVPMDVNEQGQDQESREDAGPEPGRCTVCGELDVKIPVPSCMFCPDTPCYHHGQHCPLRLLERAQLAAERASSVSEPSSGGPELGRCTVCGELDENIPYPYCLFCQDTPCYHHGTHCPLRMWNRAQLVAQQARERAGSGSEPAGGGSGAENEAVLAIGGPAAGRELMRVESILHFDPNTGRYYNAQGVWCDSEGRLLPDNGRNWGNQCLRGLETSGQRSQLPSERPSGGSASRSGSQNPPWHTESGQPAAARGPPAAAKGKGKGKGSHRAKGSPAAKGPPAAAPRNMSQPAAAPRSSRASSMGPPPQTERGRANRTDWWPRDWRNRGNEGKHNNRWEWQRR